MNVLVLVFRDCFAMWGVAQCRMVCLSACLPACLSVCLYVIVCVCARARAWLYAAGCFC